MDPLSTLAGKTAKEAGKAAVSAAGDAIGSTAVSAAVDSGILDSLLGKFSLRVKNYFRRYLQNAEIEYNEIRTLATYPEHHPMIGDSGLYVEVNVFYEKGGMTQEISASTVKPLLNISKRILIEGSGGMGKSMLMKYFFLNTLHGGAGEAYIPVFLDLRRVREQTAGQISIPKLVYSCMKNLDVELPERYFAESLRMGKYLFLMDGFDEVMDSLSAETADKINQFSAKYPKNAYIVTSRPLSKYEGRMPFHHFTKMESMPLNKGQAKLLAKKISRTYVKKEDLEKAEEFCAQLDKTFYRDYQSFVENPLLLSMMFLTFMRNSSIPNYLPTFYRESYDALYSKHDTYDKGLYEREFKCGSILGYENFKKLFSRFCFTSYLFQEYDFSEEEILDLLQALANKLNFKVDAKAYLSDLCDIVCMIVQEGRTYRFSHRSFQEYFAAVYTKDNLSDPEQRDIINETMKFNAFGYYRLLFQIEEERFIVNAFEDRFRKLLSCADNSDEPNICLLKCTYSALKKNATVGKKRVDYYPVCSDNINSALFAIGKSLGIFQSKHTECVHFDGLTKKFVDQLKSASITWDAIDTSPRLSNQQKSDMYAHIITELHIPEFREEMRKWLDNLDAKRVERDALKSDKDFRRKIINM